MYRALDQAEIARLLLDGRAYRAIAVAHATRVSKASTWTTPRGDSLVANAGDWWVMDGQQRRAVAGDVFALTYESVGGGLYRKLVTVRAVSVDTPFSLQTREGRASGAAGLYQPDGCELRVASDNRWVRTITVTAGSAPGDAAGTTVWSVPARISTATAGAAPAPARVRLRGLNQR